MHGLALTLEPWGADARPLPWAVGFAVGRKSAAQKLTWRQVRRAAAITSWLGLAAAMVPPSPAVPGTPVLTYVAPRLLLVWAVLTLCPVNPWPVHSSASPSGVITVTEGACVMVAVAHGVTWRVIPDARGDPESPLQWTTSRSCAPR